MNIIEARDIWREFYNISNPSEEEEFVFIEALEFLIVEANDAEAMLSLGGHYYGKKRYDLALKYYEMAASYGNRNADECLGYIWYYGRTGERDFKKAFEYYSKAMERGSFVCTYKIADMYKNGYYVEKDYDKYVQIIEELYPKVSTARNVFDPLPEVFTRLASIRKEQGKPEEAAELYIRAKDFLAQRISYDDFFGNLNIMKWLIEDLYEIIEFDKEFCDIYDMYFVLKNPAKIEFTCDGVTQHLESLMENGACVIHFNDAWYHGVDEFFQKATINGEKLTAIYDRLEDFMV